MDLGEENELDDLSEPGKANDIKGMPWYQHTKIWVRYLRKDNKWY
jgi:hypothetical protein